jgi:hypothetical protein
MQDVVIGVQGTVTDGARDIELLVHSHNVGNPSPCHVYENGIYQEMIGGSISSLDQIFEFEAAKHQGFEVKRRAYYLARIDSELREKQRADDDSESENHQSDHD